MTTSQSSVSPSITVAEITAALTAIVAAELGVDPSSIRPDTDLRAEQGADSVKVLRTIAKVEREYDIELEDEEVFGASTVGEIANVVYRTVTAS
jgi:acyl carrier protein